MARSFYGESKRVRNDRIKRELGVRLAFPTYREGLKAILEAEPRLSQGRRWPRSGRVRTLRSAVGAAALSHPAASQAPSLLWEKGSHPLS